MNVLISSDAELDIKEGFRFYEEQQDGLGIYFRDSSLVDIDSLKFHGGIHQVINGYHCMLAKTFPFAIYYSRSEDEVTVVAVLGSRRNPSWIRKRLS
jgi:hypothetical protein